MRIVEIVQKLEEEIKRDNKLVLINEYETYLSKNAEELSKIEKFFNLPLNNIFSVISKIDFTEIEDNDKIMEIIQNIIKNLINSHFEEKEAILILQNLNIKTTSFSSHEEIFSILELITNCPILDNYCNLYKEQNKEVDIDYEYELQQKDKEIEELKQNTNYQMLSFEPKAGILTKEEILNKFPPITEKPVDYEPDIFIACEQGKLSSVQWLIEKENEDKNKIAPYISLAYFPGDTPLHITTQCGHLPIVQYLIEIQNVDIEIKGDNDKTPLHYAFASDNIDIARYLISKGANLEARDKDNQTPLHYNEDFAANYAIKLLSFERSKQEK